MNISMQADLHITGSEEQQKDSIFSKPKDQTIKLAI